MCLSAVAVHSCWLRAAYYCDTASTWWTGYKLQSGATCSRVCTFLSGHLDWFPVAECSFAFPRCVHFVLDAAVDDPKLYLRRTSGKD